MTRRPTGLNAVLSGDTPPATHLFPATDQTKCWDPSGATNLEIPCADTGQDGDKAGATLSYTDNGDGTITDNNTGFIWEKKSDDGTIHDKETTYTWADSFAVHIAGLNAGGGFAGHTDWRLPNVKELQSIVSYEVIPTPGPNPPAVSAAFNSACLPGCTVLTCSCTANFEDTVLPWYWSSTTAPSTIAGSFVDFMHGHTFDASKMGTFRVRA